MLHVLYLFTVKRIRVLEWSVESDISIWVLFVKIDRLLVRGGLFELLSELSNFLVYLDILWVTGGEGVVFLKHFLRLSLELSSLGNGFVLSEEISEFLLEFYRVVKFRGRFWALYVEP